MTEIAGSDQSIFASPSKSHSPFHLSTSPSMAGLFNLSSSRNVENAWPRGNIWAPATSNGVISRTATHAASRGSIHKSHGQAVEEIEGKTGSGSLVESSVSDEQPSRSWPKILSFNEPARFADSSLFMNHSRRPISNRNVPISPSRNGEQAGASLRTSPQRTSPTFLTPRGSTSAFGSPEDRTTSIDKSSFNVYTKPERPVESRHGKFDSITRIRFDSAVAPSAFTESRLEPSQQHFRQASASEAPFSDSFSAAQRQTERLPAPTSQYSPPDTRLTPPSSRAASISSVYNGAHKHSFSSNYELPQAQNARQDVYRDGYRSASFANPTFSKNDTTGTLTISPVDKPFAYRNTEDIGWPRAALEDSFPTNYTSSSRSFVIDGGARADADYRRGAFLSGDALQFSPGHKLGSSFGLPSTSINASYNGVSAFDMRNGKQESPTFAQDMSALSPNMNELHPLDFNFQRAMTAHMRNPYTPMYAQFPLAAPMPFHMAAPYMSMLPFTMPAIDHSSYTANMTAAVANQDHLLFKFANSAEGKCWELSDIYGHIVQFCGDQGGSRFIQTKLVKASSEEKDRVFQEIKPNATQLMTDVFGNYVIQKFFEHGEQTHKRALANIMKGQVLSLSLQTYGCRVVQKALDHVLVDQQIQFIGELEDHVMQCVKDQNGNHVIQKAIEQCPATNVELLVRAFRGSVYQLSVHPYGCRVIQRCLEKPGLQSKASMISELYDGIQTMISDHFGNYVVQHIVSFDTGEGKRRVLALIAHGLEAYSKHKFASNVVEKCLEEADDAWRRDVVSMLSYNPHKPDSEHVLTRLIKDNFGNYVVQKLLDTLCKEDFKVFLDLLRPAMAKAKRTGCTKQLIAIEEKMRRPCTPASSSASSSAFNPQQHATNVPPFQSPFQIPPGPLTGTTRSPATSPPVSPMTATLTPRDVRTPGTLGIHSSHLDPMAMLTNQTARMMKPPTAT